MPYLPPSLKTEHEKTIIILGAAIITLSSCGGDSGLKSMVEKAVKLECRKDELRDKAFEGDAAAAKETEDIEKELKELKVKFSEISRQKEGH